MPEVEIKLELLVGSLVEDSWLTVEQLAAACAVDADWLLARLDAGFLPQTESAAGVWRFSPAAIRRARRMRQFERDFDAAPELAALIADLLDEADVLRARLRAAGLESS